MVNTAKTNFSNKKNNLINEGRKKHVDKNLQ